MSEIISTPKLFTADVEMEKNLDVGGTLTVNGTEISSTEIAALDGVTAGTVTASKAVVVDSNKDVGDFRNVDAVNIDAGASGTAGTVDVFPTTAAKGKFILSCTDQDADTNVTLKPAAMGQATAVSIPDPGAATANVLLTDAANDGVVVTATAAEINGLADGATATAAEVNAVCDASAQDVAFGSGFTPDVAEHACSKIGNMFYTAIMIDLTNVNSGGTAGDIIGDADTANAHIGQLVAAKHGTTIVGIKMTCLETPATGDDDIDLYSADEGTGTEDTGIGALTNGTQLTNGGNLTAGTVVGMTAPPNSMTQYLYLVAQTGDANATYTAGKLLIEMWGV